MKVITGRQVYSVAEVNSQARSVLENLSFWVEAEVSSLKGENSHYRYIYFDLKDPQTGYKISCIMEPATYQSLDFDFTEGAKVLALGNLTLWEKDGRYQMYVFKLEAYGEGELALAFEKLKNKLALMGYFEQVTKAEIPKFPTKIAVVTSESSDAWHDFKKHSVDMHAHLRLSVFDVLVQGRSSASQIIAALKKIDAQGFDVVALIRGGGSLEDLASFNDENLASTIHQLKTPIVVGVGHEKDITIASLVADVAASTPTDAAKIITADWHNLDERLTSYARRLNAIYSDYLGRNSQALDTYLHKLTREQEKVVYVPQKLAHLKKELQRAANASYEMRANKLAQTATALSSLYRLHFKA